MTEFRAFAAVATIVACTPLHDFDEVTREYGRESFGGRAGGGSQSTNGGTLLTGGRSGAGAVSGQAGVSQANGGSVTAGGSGQGGQTSASGGASAGGQTPASGGTIVGDAAGGQAGGCAGDAGDDSGGVPSSSGGTSASGGTAGQSNGGDATALPIDLPNNPVSGTFIVSQDATWEVNGTFLPTFEIHTPSASYWLVKSLAMIVSIVDAGASDTRQWIDFSSGYRPLRGLPSYASFGSSNDSMTTTLDGDSQTPTHVRLFSVSQSHAWRLVWDFYPTHVTLTVNSAPAPYGLAYRGVPAGALDSSDRFVLGDGSSQAATVSSVTDWAGPAEWVYVADTTFHRSLFAIHHGDDSVGDRYQVKDNDSALISFGDGALTKLPQRFSFGIIASSDHTTVKTRAQFVINAIH